ncbi:PREDICTED: kinetochore protein spc25-like [Tarenaya hassleriana]|uniref:kinetochore protein spc25-like n=1 Tax=Tarenaya hassleriana TaxID=28532 RepID=UPI00053C244B|nr:PREDICTED: kinetochore protein spc25-like [Tarenaya hassleriana]
MEQISGGDTTKKTMDSLRLMVEKEIHEQRQRIESFTTLPFQRSMDSLVERAQATARSQVELAKMKAELREAEDELVRVLAVKTRKEARQMGIRDIISATKSRIEVLRRTVQLQKAKKDEYVAVISQQLQALETSKENVGKDIEDKGDIEEAISWYNRVLGFHVEAGHGVKFKFTNVDASNPNREYSITIHYGNNIYTLLDCNPQMNDIKELVQELNDTNDLFRFVRLMREKFLKATLPGLLPTQSENIHQESSMISISAPVTSSSIDTSSMSTPESKESRALHEVNRQHKRASYGTPVASPASSCRRSSRLKAKK